MRTQVRNSSRKTAGLVALLLSLGALLVLTGCVGLTSASQPSSNNSSSALTIDPPAATSVTSSTAMISWSTTLAATSQVDYGTTSSYGSQTTVNSTMVMSHSQALSGLQPGQLYHYRVVSSDSRTQAVSPDFTFTTASTNSAAPPTVSITAPAANANVSGTVTATATASSSVGIASVQFQVDGSNVGSAVTSSPYSYSWNTTTLANGTHTLTAVAKDTSSQSTTSTSVSVKVSNAVAPPAVSITGPASGAKVSGTVTVTATSSSSVGIASVQFQLDGGNVGSAVTASPYSYSWNTTTVSNGSHTLAATAKDTSSNSTTSTGVTVTVSNSTTPPTVPSGLSATAISSSQINLSWTPSTSAVGVAGYKVYRAGSQIGTATNTSYSDTGLTASTSYSYTVAAYDAAGNTSAQSASASATTSAASSSGGLPTALGWYQIPNTQLQSVCPPNNYGGSGYDFPSNCATIITAWGGGIADTSRNRLLVWGGGHSNYGGNEIYALDLNALTMTRLNNPALPLPSSCVETLSGPSPNSRHTYDDLAYVPSSDEMVSVTGDLFTGGGPNVGCASNATWTLSMSNLQWTQQSPSGTPPSYQGGLAAISYDPNTKLVFISNESYGQFASYDPVGNTYNLLNGHALTDYHLTSIIDPTRKVFLMFGAGQAWKIDISGNDPNYALTAITGSGCGFASALYPGLAFDSTQKLVVGWSGGNTVYLYNPTTDSCSAVTYPNGPGSQQPNGTYKRFSYFPALNVFALVNDATQNAYVLRLTSGSGTGGSTSGSTPPSGPVVSAVSASSITTTGATITWTTDVVSTSQVEYGTTTAYGTLATLNSTMLTGHSQALTGLAVNTAYHYRVHSTNSSGVASVSGDFVFATNNTASTTPPTVSISSPATNSTVSGTVTVSAVATDSVGVASVQFLLDGAVLGSQISSFPYSTSWDTTSAGNGTHTLSARAIDTAGNAATASVSVTVSNATSNGDAITFQTRCQAPGVIECDAMDTTADTVPYFGAAGGGAGTGVLDTTVFPPGSGTAGSAKLTVPANQGGADLAGNWNKAWPQGFGQNTDFYVQYRMRMDSNFTNYNWAAGSGGGGGHKFSIFHYSTDSCAGVEVTTQDVYQRGYPQMYGNCGAIPYETDLGNGDYLYEQGNPVDGTTTTNTPYNCHRNSSTAQSCAVVEAPFPTSQQHPDEWLTFYYHVHVGTWGTGSSSINAWLAYQGGSLEPFINLQNMVINCNNSPCSSDPSVFNHTTLTIYNTGYTGTGNPQASVWYCCMIVSKNPIPAPNGPTP